MKRCALRIFVFLLRGLARPGVWLVLGLAFHAVWLWMALAVSSNADCGLHAKLTAWVESHRAANQGGPAYMVAFGYLFNAVITILSLGVACNIVSLTLGMRRHLREKRINSGLCPKCAYDLRGSDSPSCPECGATR